MRSIIQLAGRVKRHRKFDCLPAQPNILLLDSNVRRLKHGDNSAAFMYPGFESELFPLKTHSLQELLTPEQYQTIDARARIRQRDKLDPKGNLADLEHDRLADMMLGAKTGKSQQQIPAHWWWTTNAILSGVLQSRTRFRDDPQGHQSYYFRPDEDCAAAEFHWLADSGKEIFVESNLLQRIELSAGPRISSWGAPSYLDALQTLAEAQGMEPTDCARKFGIVDLPGYEASQIWRYHPALGFSRT